MKVFQDITLGQHVPGVSIIHRLDPRTKIVSLIILIISVFNLGSLIPLLIAGVLTVFLIELASFSIKFVIRGVALFFWLFAFTAVFHLFFTSGDSVYPFPVWGVNMTWQGLSRGLTVFIQLLLVIVISNIFTLTTSPRELTLGIEKLLHPLKYLGVKTGEIALMITLIIRFIPILKGETEKIFIAQKARGIDFSRGSLVSRSKNIITVLSPLFTNLFARTDSLVLAMLCRGFGQRAERGCLKELAFGKTDFIAFTVAILFSAISIIHY